MQIARGVLVFLYSALFWSGAAVCIPASAQADGALFDSSIVQDIHLTMEQEDWATLRARYDLNGYYPADFSWNGVSISNVGIRSRGSGSRSPEKPNFKVKFNEFVKGQKLFQQKAIILKANNQDASMMREFLAMAVYRKLGLPAVRESFARVHLNGDFLGLYVIVEDVDENFLDRVYGESDGFLYEYNTQWGYRFEYRGHEASAYGPDMWQPQTREDEPELETLFDMLQVVNHAPDEAYEVQVAPYLDLDAFVRLLAAQDYLAEVDGLLSISWGMNNFYLYRAEDTTKFRFIPWDADYSFNWVRRPLMQDIEANVLARRSLDVPRLRQLYVETMVQAAALTGDDDGWLTQEAERVYNLIAVDARRDPHKQCMASGSVQSCDAGQFEAEAASVLHFAANRMNETRNALDVLLGNPVPHMNAISAINTELEVLSPGALASIYGRSMAEAGEVAEDAPLPQILGDVQVTINGAAVPLLFVSPELVNFQVPWNIGGDEAVVSISAGGIEGNTVTVPLEPTAPGWLVATHLDDRPVTASAPIAPGEILILYATGLGPVELPVPDGQPAPLDRLAPTKRPVSVWVDSTEAEVLFSGLAPGLVGAYQVNVRLPENLGDGQSVNLVLGAGNASSLPLPLEVRQEVQE